ncbi:MAG: hypothetical protein ABR589_12850, partial [Chthoniobacterales bacterium]
MAVLPERFRLIIRVNISFGISARRQFARALWALIILCVAAGTRAEQLKEARVTHVIRDVKLLPEQAAPRDAVVNDDVHDGTAVRTGVESRTELTFTDQT